MEAKAKNPVDLLQDQSAPALLEAYFEFNHLKQLYRQGWLQRGLPKDRCESVAEHTFGVAVLAFFLAEAHFPELDAGRVLRLALLHDFGEIFAGDIIPGDAVPAAEKHRLERQAVVRVFGKLAHGERYLALWEEYEQEGTAEARFVHQVDRLEMALQASVYAMQGMVDPAGFFASARLALSDPPLVALEQAAEAATKRQP
ncbi:MAG TPA: HD domain-containing protein [Anaerolineales bacterium]